MKHIIIIFLIYLFCIAAHAESRYFDTLTSDRNHWTVTVGYDASIPGNWKEGKGSYRKFNAGSGINIGVDYMCLIGNNFYFEPGARVFIDNYSFHNHTIGAGTPSEPAKTYDPPVRKTGFRVPLTAGYKLDIFKRGSLFLSMGPEPIVGFSARTEVDEEHKKYLRLLDRYPQITEIASYGDIASYLNISRRQFQQIRERQLRTLPKDENINPSL